MRNQKVLHNFVVPSCGYPPECPVTHRRQRVADSYLHLTGTWPAFVCFPQKDDLGRQCAEHWQEHFPAYTRDVTVTSHNETWGTWDDTLRSVAEAEKFAREQGYDTVHHYLVSDPTQLGRMWLIAKFNGIKNVRCIRVSESGRPWRDIFPHEIFSYGKVFLKGSLVLLKRLWKALN